MKKLNYIVLCLFAIAIVWQGCKKEESEEETGSIYGVVTDKATGEPIKNVGVELKPLGKKTVTGSEGQFEFSDIAIGSYNLYITKTGYTEFTSNAITVSAGQTTQTDVHIEKWPSIMRIVDEGGNEIDELNFGDQESDVARSFNIFNDGTASLEWEITNTTNWITSVSIVEGTLNAGEIQAVIIVIDRDKLNNGENVTTVQITSNYGSKQLYVKAGNEWIADNQFIGSWFTEWDTGHETITFRDDNTFRQDIFDKGDSYFYEGTYSFTESTITMDYVEFIDTYSYSFINETTLRIQDNVYRKQ